MKPKLITAPATDPVTLEDVKAHLRVFFNDDDPYIAALIKAAVSHLDAYRGILNRCIVSQAWQTTYCRFCRTMETPFTDTTAVVMKYYDADDVLQTIDDESYRAYSDHIEFVSGYSFPQIERRDDAVQMISTHGYDVVPDSLLLAIKILIAHWYRNRVPVAFSGTAVKIPYTVASLLAPHTWAF